MAKTKKIKSGPSNITKRARYIPLCQILGEMHPYKRMLMLSHLDPTSIDGVSDVIRLTLQNGAEGKIKGTLNQKINKILSTHKTQFKNALGTTNSWKTKRKALTQIGGSAIGVLLSVAVPLILSALQNK